ncbi:polysaccharide biosynthesis protein [Pasteurella atlantica]|uniref:polysaccharide biosynthesis protein n=1 Tax=Pasteurellaceae TaxID=712 RepID=UPI002755238C|nr:nucleoside-diphosphate sugar epimerase/dehydratase [Pasteurella atlantica]MDP8098740.1 nucleoside-diphosphate sugar epimerase/dehydratase [Pasteurella atlantica]MDP8106852.1 nucleoside-diphosphate sugar epimerase/dehydratase [Pasteurella atlantica]MDP8116542.1 nucleoside-diphosphate sugar epimerase/dehydratase [Pasteurella atlantica]
MINLLLKQPRWLKKLIFVLHDIILIFCSFWLALAARVPFKGEWKDVANWKILATTIIFSLVIFTYLGLYRAVMRYAGGKIINIVFWGSLSSVAIMLSTAFYLHIPFPRSVPIMYFLLVLVLMIGSRFTIKGLLQTKDKRLHHPVVIYGAGESGRQLLLSMKQVTSYYPVAFVDDDISLQNTVIYNKTVYSPSKLTELIELYQVESILLAMPSATKLQQREIIQNLEHLPCKILTMPGLKDLVEGKVSVSALKKVSIIDLLGRDAVDPVPELMSKDIQNKVVMVTGAGGSIGSELCRQIIQQSPQKLVLFELSEFSLYSIEKELSDYVAKNNLDIEIIPAMGSVQHQRRLFELMTRFNVQTLYHAAAYKHVPLVEYNTIEGVRNNIFGTLYCAKAAIEAKVETFVLISTDKAVRPTNTMGTTKRMAELVLQALAEQKDHNTRFCMVRFGNVLGSSGSVIPLFEKQIANGGPVTITHKDITRFFMTIPEAAQLVIQAGAMGKGGDVFLLDMGEPVKIIDLARQMINLSGFEVKDEHSPNGDIEIKVTGLRPGEKLYEELLIGQNAEGTTHPRIMTTKEKMLHWKDLEQILLTLEDACKSFEPDEIREILLSAPTDFKPSDPVCDILCK